MLDIPLKICQSGRIRKGKRPFYNKNERKNKLNKISKSLIALMMAGMLFSMDAAATATLTPEAALPTTSGPVAPSGGAMTSQLPSNKGQLDLKDLPPTPPVQTIEMSTYGDSTMATATKSKKKKCPANATCIGNKASKFICNAGYYKKSNKATSCTKCSAGTYSLAGASKCMKCPAGTYSSAGASACKTCPKKKKPNAAQTACIKA